ncbi:hypothetical protein BDF20DRAFT_861652 [Mycotypha africana]|uniref:uncharacterized protein n=1 Tax=Mycotypha africana TaxID=64632 RepID=UPI002301F57B|nr:uncharacterized protein BDF20DRAFT_861652 [Mycotypha africana]KAI8984764.1 hypothetical protein BDF20DRAFT_861652 [Mycotypha africana]
MMRFSIKKYIKKATASAISSSDSSKNKKEKNGHSTFTSSSSEESVVLQQQQEQKPASVDNKSLLQLHLPNDFARPFDVPELHGDYINERISVLTTATTTTTSATSPTCSQISSASFFDANEDLEEDSYNYNNRHSVEQRCLIVDDLGVAENTVRNNGDSNRNGPAALCLEKRHYSIDDQHSLSIAGRKSDESPFSNVIPTSGSVDTEASFNKLFECNEKNDDLSSSKKIDKEQRSKGNDVASIVSSCSTNITDIIQNTVINDDDQSITNLLAESVWDIDDISFNTEDEEYIKSKDEEHDKQPDNTADVVDLLSVQNKVSAKVTEQASNESNCSASVIYRNNEEAMINFGERAQDKENTDTATNMNGHEDNEAEVVDEIDIASLTLTESKSFVAEIENSSRCQWAKDGLAIVRQQDSQTIVDPTLSIQNEEKKRMASFIPRRLPTNKISKSLKVEDGQVTTASLTEKPQRSYIPVLATKQPYKRRGSTITAIDRIGNNSLSTTSSTDSTISTGLSSSLSSLSLTSNISLGSANFVKTSEVTVVSSQKKRPTSISLIPKYNNCYPSNKQQITVAISLSSGSITETATATNTGDPGSSIARSSNSKIPRRRVSVGLL